MNHNTRHRIRRSAARIAGTFALTSLASQIAMAAPFESSDGTIKGSFDSTMTAGFGIRAKNPSCGLTGDPTAGGSGACGAAANTAMWSAGDDGNLNYRKGDFFTAYVKGTHELLLKMPEQGLSAMVRGSYLLDAAADRTDRTELSSESKRKVARDVRLLDLWVAKSFSLGGQDGRVRIGNQVVNWGESLFLPGGINATNSLDYQRLQIPGTQLKEAVLPAPMVSVASSLGGGVNVEAYYQWKWNPNRYAPIGTYWSASDIGFQGERQPVNVSTSNFNAATLDGAGLLRNQGAQGRISQAQLAAINAATIGGSDPSVFSVPIAPDVKPKNSGQWGVSAHYKPDNVQADFGAYAVRYHDKAPVLNTVGGTQYQFQYLENRMVYGLSTNFPVGNWAIGGELSYRPKDAVALGGCFTPGQPLDANVNLNPIASADCPNWMETKKYEMHLTALLYLQKSEQPFILEPLGADSGFFSVEFVATRYPGVNPAGMTRSVNGVAVTQLPASGYAFWFDNPYDPAARPKGVGTANSYGIIGDFNWTYDGTVIPGWQVTPGLTYFRGLKGNNPTFAATLMQGVQSANVYVLFNQNPTKWQAGLNYTTYFGGGERNFYKDRAFFGGFVAYNF